MESADTGGRRWERDSGAAQSLRFEPICELSGVNQIYLRSRQVRFVSQNAV